MDYLANGLDFTNIDYVAQELAPFLLLALSIGVVTGWVSTPGTNRKQP